VVSIVLETAAYTSEEALPVSFIDAPWAGDRSIFWGDVDYWNAHLKGFVFDEELELAECPAVEVSVLASPMLCLVADSRKLFHNNHVAFFEAVHESPANLMQDRVCISPLSSTQPFQSAFSRLCAFALERGAEPSKTLSFTRNFSTFDFEAVGSYKRVFHADVHADRIVAFRLWGLFGDVEEELLVSVDENRMGGFNVFKKFFSGNLLCQLEA